MNELLDNVVVGRLQGVTFFGLEEVHYLQEALFKPD